MRNGFTPRKVVVALLAGVVGCSSGQTGSPDCVGTDACVCDPLSAGGAVARVRVDSYGEGMLAVEVIEVVKPRESTGANQYQLEPGERLGGLVMETTPCAPSGAEPIPDTELLVSYDSLRAGDVDNCGPFQHCAESRCQGLNSMLLEECWQTCMTDTAATCDELRQAGLLDGLFNWAVPWGEQLDFGDGLRLGSSEVGVLADYQSCIERFPAPQPPPCNDTSSGLSCSAIGPRNDATNAPRAALSVLLGAGAAWLLIRRRGDWPSPRKH
jgi:hypothetical protein